MKDIGTSTSFWVEQIVGDLLTAVLLQTHAERISLMRVTCRAIGIGAQAIREASSIKVDMHWGNFVSSDVPSGLLDAVIEERRHLAVDDIREAAPLFDNSNMRHRAFHSLLCVPIVRNGTVTGMVLLESNAPIHMDAKDRVTLEQIMAHALAMLDPLRMELQAEASSLRHSCSETEQVGESADAKADRLASYANSQSLSSIISSAGAGMRWLGNYGGGIAERKESLWQVASDAARAIEVLGGIRSLIRTSNSRFADFDVNNVASGVVSLAAGEIGAQAIQIHMELYPAELVARGDRVLIEQLLLDLLQNAVDALTNVKDRERSISIRSGRGTPDTVWLEVIDNGVGVDDASIENVIFAPFYTTKPARLGIGLSVGRTIAELHGGQLSAYRRDPHGFTFQLSMPTNARGALTDGPGSGETLNCISTG